MKRIILTLACTCMVLAVLAGIPQADATISSHATRTQSCAVTPSSHAEKTGQRTLHQFLREHKLSPNDNRLTNRAPQRLSPEEMTGSRIVVMEAQGVEDFDDNGNPIMSDMVYSLGWGNDVFSWANGAYDNDSLKYYGIDGFYGKYQLPFKWNEETGEPMLYSNYLVYEDTTKGYFNFNTRVDTVRTVIFYTMSDFFENGNDEECPGTVFDDGTMLFEGQYLIYTEEEHLKYYRFPMTETVTLTSRDTVAYISPIISNIYLIYPNGIHEYNDSTSASSGNPYYARMDDIQLQSIYYGHCYNQDEPVHNPLDINIVGGSGGLVPKPIKPGRPRPSIISPVPIIPVEPVNPNYAESSTPSYMSSDADISSLLTNEINNYQTLNTVASYSPNSSLNKASNGLHQAPVYMFQYDDSTVIVLNLFGIGSTFNAIYIHEDGTMSLPGQALFYDPDLNDDFCNYSLVNDTLVLGNTGVATPDAITWDLTVPHGLDNSYPGYFDNNRLYFTDGSQFILPVPFLRGDVNRDRKVSIADVTSLISSLLTDVYDYGAHFSTEAADVN